MSTMPISLMRDNYVRNIVKVTNECGLPPMIIEYVLKDVLSSVHSEVVRIAQAESEEYKKELLKSASKLMPRMTTL